MRIFIILFGLFIISIAVTIMLRPESFTGILTRHARAAWVHLLAVVVRIVFGLVLVFYAEQSRFPLALQIIGWIAIVAGVMLALLPREKFARLLMWALERFSSYLPFAALIATILGGFLIYAVI